MPSLCLLWNGINGNFIILLLPPKLSTTRPWPLFQCMLRKERIELRGRKQEGGEGKAIQLGHKIRSPPTPSYSRGKYEYNVKAISGKSEESGESFYFVSGVGKRYIE